VPKVTDAHRRARRLQILAGARRAFARWGYEGATVARLEEEIGLSRGAIFSYYRDKWSLFYALAERDYERFGRLWLDEGYAGVLRALASEGREWLSVYLELVRKLGTNPELRDQWRHRNPELDRRLQQRVEEMQQTAELRRDVDASAIGMFLGVFLDGVAVQISAGYDVDVESLLPLVLSALAPQ
jgi:TetR/AcrR family transcriptional regulator, transcriptional repressor of aconitase